MLRRPTTPALLEDPYNISREDFALSGSGDPVSPSPADDPKSVSFPEPGTSGTIQPSTIRLSYTKVSVSHIMETENTFPAEVTALTSALETTEESDESIKAVDEPMKRSAHPGFFSQRAPEALDEATLQTLRERFAKDIVSTTIGIYLDTPQYFSGYELSPFKVLGFYKFTEHEGTTYHDEFAQLLELANSISQTNGNCMPLKITEEMYEDLKDIQLISFPGGSFCLNGDAKKITQFYATIRHHWQKEIARLTRLTNTPEKLEKAAHDLFFILENYEKIAMDYYQLFKRIARYKELDPVHIATAKAAHIIPILNNLSLSTVAQMAPVLRANMRPERLAEVVPHLDHLRASKLDSSKAARKEALHSKLKASWQDVLNEAKEASPSLKR